MACFVALTGVGTRLVARHFLFPTGGLARVEARAERPVALVARDGVPVHALRFDGASRDGRVAVVFHGNRETIEDNVELAGELVTRGLSVMLVEYRGYGHSEAADPSEEGLYLDAEAALDHLAASGVADDRITLVGRSLGTGVAAEMASRARGTRLVLITPYTSIPDVVTDVMPILPARLLMPDHFDTLSKCARIRVPTLVIHGDRDEVVPFWMGERLVASIAGARLLRVAGGRHGDLFGRSGLLDAIAGFAG